MAVGGVDRIMLDNFTPADTKGWELIGGKYETGSSGGITFDTLRHVPNVAWTIFGRCTHHSVKSLI